MGEGRNAASVKGIDRSTPAPISARPQEQIVFIGDFLFPEGDAAAVRTLALALLSRDLGFRVTVIGKGQLRPEDYDRERNGYYIEGVRYLTMNPEKVTPIQRLRHPIKRLWLYESTLETLDLSNTRAVIINACDSARHVPFVKSFCERKSIPLIGDVCEWYDPSHRKYGGLNPSYIVFSLVFHKFLPRFKNLIVVSKLLESQFEGQGRHVLRIAAPMDVQRISCGDHSPTNSLVLLYAGSPGQKDQLGVILEALASLTPIERLRIEFRLLGPTEQELTALLGESVGLLSLLAGTVKPLGRVPRQKVLEALQGATFSILLRPDKRYARAGFPSKVPESLAAGVPMILTLTGDLDEHLSDGMAALLVPDCSPASVATAIRRALALTPTELQGLRRNARRKAEQSFDYRIYLDSFRSYLDRLQ
jgi:glycosyltransferase involved in cell wall biosynthesis